MTNKISTEEKIFNSARKVFIHYGFHGTTINKIAVDARVNKATIHYYFRSKEKLYAQVVKYELNYMLSSRDNFISEQIWFFNTEQYNNKKLFVFIISHENKCEND